MLLDLFFDTTLNYTMGTSISRAISSCLCFSSEVLSWRIRKLKQVFHVGSFKYAVFVDVFSSRVTSTVLSLIGHDLPGVVHVPGGRE